MYKPRYRKRLDILEHIPLCEKCTSMGLGGEEGREGERERGRKSTTLSKRISVDNKLALSIYV
jgi:hypothetical protein